MNIAVIDDEKIYRDYVLDYFSKNSLYQVDCYKDGETFLSQNIYYDLLILDIELPGLKGIEISKLIPNKSCKVIFLTSYQSYMFDAFHENVIGYVLKQNIQRDLHIKIEDFLKRKNSKLTLNTNLGEYQIYLEDIIYIEYCRKIVYIYLKLQKKIEVFCNLKDMSSSLNDSFVYINRNQVVNLAYISSIRDSKIKTLYSNETFYVSRYRIKEVQKRYLEMLSCRI